MHQHSFQNPWREQHLIYVVFAVSFRQYRLYTDLFYLEDIFLHTRKTIYLNLSLISKFVTSSCTFFTFYRLSRYILSCKFFILLFFSLENDDMESSTRGRRNVVLNLFRLFFIIRYLTKCYLIHDQVFLAPILT